MKNINPDLLRLGDMLQAIDDIENIGFALGSPRKDLLATAYSIAVIGEAVSRLSQTLKGNYTMIPWRDMISMRHKIIHEYGKIDVAVLLAVVTDDIPLLKQQITGIVKTIEAKQ